MNGGGDGGQVRVERVRVTGHDGLAFPKKVLPGRTISEEGNHKWRWCEV